MASDARLVMYLSDAMYTSLKAEQVASLRNELLRYPGVYEVVGELKRQSSEDSSEAAGCTPDYLGNSPTVRRASHGTSYPSVPPSNVALSGLHTIERPPAHHYSHPQSEYSGSVPHYTYLPLSANVVTKSVTGGAQLGSRYDTAPGSYMQQSTPVPPRTAYSLFAHEREPPSTDSRPPLISRPTPASNSTTSASGSFVVHRQSIDPDATVLNHQPPPVLKESEVQVDIQALERPGGNRAWKETCTTPSVIGKMRKFTIRVSIPTWIGQEWRASYQGYDHARSLADPTSGDTNTKTNIFKFHGGRMTSIVFQVEVENTSEKMNNNGLFLCQHERKKEDSYHPQLSLVLDFSDRDCAFTHFFLIPKWGRTRTRDHQFQVRMCLIINEEYVYHLLTFPISIAAHQHESKYPANPTSYSTIVNLQKATI